MEDIKMQISTTGVGHYIKHPTHIVHGRFVKNHYECTKCGADIPSNIKYKSYCPNCGCIVIGILSEDTFNVK